jgi:hypothetical protein
MPGAEHVRNALCGNGRSVPVRFDHRQVERKDNDGRQLPSHFDKLGGDVFRIIGATVEVTATCFLVGNGWISGATVVPMQTAEQHAGCGNGVEARLAESKGRAVVRCFPLGRLGKEGRVVLAEFARVGNDALASVVMVGGRLLFGNYSAEFRGAGADLWRVDDGGELSAEGFHVVFVAHRRDRFALATDWAGTEGRSLALFVSASGNGLNRVVEDYWYQLPE